MKRWNNFKFQCSSERSAGFAYVADVVTRKEENVFGMSSIFKLYAKASSGKIFYFTVTREDREDLKKKSPISKLSSQSLHSLKWCLFFIFRDQVKRPDSRNMINKYLKLIYLRRANLFCPKILVKKTPCSS